MKINKNKIDPIVIRAFFLFCCSGMMANAMGTVLRSLRDPVYGYGIDASFQGLLSGIAQVGGLLANILSGYLPFAIGRKKSFIILALCPIIGLLVMILTGNPFLLLMAFCFQGIGKGLNSNISNVIVNQFSKNRAKDQNYLHAVFAIGAITGPILMTSFDVGSWRKPLLIIDILLTSAVILLSLSSLDNKKDEAIKEKMVLPKSLKFWINTFIMFFYLCGEASLLSYLVSFLCFSNLFETSNANLMSSLLWVMILVGRLITANVSKKINKPIYILCLGISYFIAIYSLTSSQSTISAVISLCFVGLSMSGIYPTTMSTQEEKYMSSTACSGICIGTATIATIIMPVVIGYVVDLSGSYRSGLRTLLIPILCMIILMIVKLKIEKKPQSNN